MSSHDVWQCIVLFQADYNVLASHHNYVIIYDLVWATLTWHNWVKNA